MEDSLIPIIVTIGVSTVIIVASFIGTLVVLLNHLDRRIEQSDTRAANDKAELIESARSDKAELLEAMRADKAELLEAMRSDKAELLEIMRADKREVLDAIRDTEQRLSHRMDRHEDRTDAQIDALRRELNQSAIEQPVAGDD